MRLQRTRGALDEFVRQVVGVAILRAMRFNDIDQYYVQKFTYKREGEARANQQPVPDTVSASASNGDIISSIKLTTFAECFSLVSESATLQKLC